MANFCPDPFFSLAVSWDTEKPDLTACFKFSILRLIPPILFIVSLLLGISYLIRARRPLHLEGVGISWLLISKLVAGALFGAASLADMLLAAINYGEMPYDGLILLISPAIEIIVVLIALLVYVVEYSKLDFRNPVYLIYWLAYSIAYLIDFYSCVLNLVNETERATIGMGVTSLLHLLLAITSLVLNCFSQLDNLPGGIPPYDLSQCLVWTKSRKGPNLSPAGVPTSTSNGVTLTSVKSIEGDMHPNVIMDTRRFSTKPETSTTVLRPPCPEETTSHVSYLSFFWLLNLVLKGFRKPLEEADLWTLRRSETFAENHERFSRVWEADLARWRREQALLASQTQAFAPPGGAIPMRQFGADANGAKKEAEKKKEDDEQKEDNRPSPPFIKALIKVYGWPILLSNLIQVGYAVLLYANPMLLWGMTEYMQPTIVAVAPEVVMQYLVQPWKGYAIAVLFALAGFVQATCQHQMYHTSGKASVRIRAAIIDVVYRKSLVVASSAAGGAGTGQVVTLLAVDLTRIQDSAQMLWFVWFAPFNLVLAMVLLYIQLGPVCFVGLGVMFFSFILSGFVAGSFRFFMITLMQVKEKRTKFMTELLNGIKVVKLYAWEPPFAKEVNKHRTAEQSTLLKIMLVSVLMFIVFTVAPFMVTAITFLVYSRVSTDCNFLTPTRAFVSMSLFGMMQAPMAMLPMVVSFVTAAVIALKRIATFLGLPEIKPENVSHERTPESDRYPIMIENGKFTWKPDGDIVLHNINMRVPRGKLVAVVGPVGSGKSSLISAMLGEMEKVQGKVVVASEKLAYVPQQAWIQNASVRDNILFGRPFDQLRYDHALESCALKPDLLILPGGDATEIGERGINVSGGQKQRISLARAVYANSDIYLFDDPLSAVDVHVGKHIFEQVISDTGVLGGANPKTRVLVTHGIHYLPKCDYIVCIDDQSIREQGTYAQLMADDGNFARLVRTFANEEEESDEEEDDNKGLLGDEETGEKRDADPAPLPLSVPLHSQLSKQHKHSTSSDSIGEDGAHHRRRRSSSGQATKPGYERGMSKISRTGSVAKDKADTEKTKEGDKAKGKLTDEEEAATGNVKLSVYWWYFKATGLVLFILYFVFFLGYLGAQIFASIWMSRMTDDEDFRKYVFLCEREKAMEIQDRYLWVYFGMGWAQALFVALFNIVYSFMVIKACAFVHGSLLDRVLKAPMSFFDQTPMGRILNRFTKDLDMIDFILPMTFRGFITMIGQLIATFVIIAYSTPWFIAVLVPTLIVFFLLLVLYMPTSRQLRRIESITRSPVFSLVAESLAGRSTIHAFRDEQRFIAEAARRTDENHVYNLASLISNRFLGFWVDVGNNILLLAAAMFAAAGRDAGDSTTAGMAGLSLTYALQITAIANMMVRMLNEVEVNAVAIERAKEYTEIATEASWNIEATKPEPNWPVQGHIEFKNYSTRYREGLDLVLRNLLLDIRPSEKIGICGRTGAGKSSLTLALFRLVEAADGNISIDGHNISRLGLHQLRLRLTILPQDPVIFSGTLRFNLDPFDEHSDAELWHSLELVNLREYFEKANSGSSSNGNGNGNESKNGDTQAPAPASTPNAGGSEDRGLKFKVTEGGSNLSVGQRQLLCLARALLRRTKVLILDEATAAVDYETDALIQETIRREFKDCTVLTIAHRINTILDYDRVLVLDQGRVREFDSPANLIGRGASSIFYQMVDQAGLLNQALAAAGAASSSRS